MKKITAIALSSCVAVSLIVTPQSAYAAPKTSTPAKTNTAEEQMKWANPYPSPTYEQKLAWRIFKEMNAYRTKNGKEPFTWVYNQAEGAERWSKHLGATGSFKHDVGQTAGPYSAENIFRGSKAEDAVKTWSKSPGDNANILNSKYTQAGIGVAKGRDGRWYVTAHFSFHANTNPKK